MIHTYCTLFSGIISIVSIRTYSITSALWRVQIEASITKSALLISTCSTILTFLRHTIPINQYICRSLTHRAVSLIATVITMQSTGITCAVVCSQNVSVGVVCNGACLDAGCYVCVVGQINCYCLEY